MLSKGYWENVGGLPAFSYICGHVRCGLNVSSEKGWRYASDTGNHGYLFICPSCRQPSFFDFGSKVQIPGVLLGGDVKKLPEGVGALWAEMRACSGINAYTAAVLAGRTLLMHIAVSQGAKPGQTFLQYVDYLVANHFAPPNSKVWVDKIRAHGNEATHEIALKVQADAKEIMVFLEMLLKFIYEFPNIEEVV